MRLFRHRKTQKLYNLISDAVFALDEMVDMDAARLHRNKEGEIWVRGSSVSNQNCTVQGHLRPCDRAVAYVALSWDGYGYWVRGHEEFFDGRFEEILVADSFSDLVTNRARSLPES